jgi:hypothetical protein
MVVPAATVVIRALRVQAASGVRSGPAAPAARQALMALMASR